VASAPQFSLGLPERAKPSCGHPGRCAACVYLQRAPARRRREREGPTRSRGTVLTARQRKRFWQIERKLRLDLPTRVLAAVFSISRATVNNLGKRPFSRAQGKSVFHNFQKRQSRRSLSFYRQRKTLSLPSSGGLFAVKRLHLELNTRRQKTTSLICSDIPRPCFGKCLTIPCEPESMAETLLLKTNAASHTLAGGSSTTAEKSIFVTTVDHATPNDGDCAYLP